MKKLKRQASSIYLKMWREIITEIKELSDEEELLRQQCVRMCESRSKLIPLMDLYNDDFMTSITKGIKAVGNQEIRVGDYFKFVARRMGVLR